MASVLIVAAAYVAGSIPTGYWLVRVARGVDIRTLGSGNIGASNVWRTFGRRYGVPVILVDVAKGFVPALVGVLAVGHVTGALAGAAAMLGHWRPLFLRFARGGKTVATCGGAFLGLAPLVGLLGGAVWLVVFLAFRYASLASLTGATTLPVLSLALGEPWPVTAFAAGAAVAVFVLHRANIARLLRGTENRFELRRRAISA